MPGVRRFASAALTVVGFLSGAWAGVQIDPQVPALPGVLPGLQTMIQEPPAQLAGVLVLGNLLVAGVLLGGVLVAYGFGDEPGLLAFCLAALAGGLFPFLPLVALGVFAVAILLALFGGDLRGSDPRPVRGI